MRNSQHQATTTTHPARAAQYLRASTEHQRYSTENQLMAIAAFAHQRHYEVVATYCDEGRSGLTIEGRDALQRLINDVQSGSADFSAVLVLDISRWGRFQDVDESAYYEYICRRAGIEVLYCGEEFENDGSLASSIIKTVKRGMAADYSRQLSSKVFAGQARLIKKGYRQGGLAGYGFERRLVDQNGLFKCILRKGELKAIQTDRVILGPGDAKEVETIRLVFRLFVEFRITEVRIARRLNDQGSTYTDGKPWNGVRVHAILKNPKYAGHNVYNRSSFRLRTRRVFNSPELWVRADSAFEPIVDPKVFDEAQAIMAARNRRISKDDLLKQLRHVFKSQGMLSEAIIDSYDMIRSAGTYKKVFGGLLEAYRQVGFTPRRTGEHLNQTRTALKRRHQLIDWIVASLREAGLAAEKLRLRNVIAVGDHGTVAVVVLRCFQTNGGALRWIYEYDPDFNRADTTVIARLDKSNTQEFDYYVVPRTLLGRRRLLLRERNDLELDACRCSSFDALSKALIRDAKGGLTQDRDRGGS